MSFQPPGVLDPEGVSTLTYLTTPQEGKVMVCDFHNGGTGGCQRLLRSGL